MILFGLVVGVAVFAVIFSESGPFNSLLAIPTSGALVDNAYSGIISTVFLLIPLGALAFFGMKYFNGSNMGSKMKGSSKKRSTGARKRGSAPRTRRVNYRNPSKTDIARAQKIMAAVQSRQAAGPPVV